MKQEKPCLYSRVGRVSWRGWSGHDTAHSAGLLFFCAEGIAKVLVAQIVPDNQRGTVYESFNASLGLMALSANLIVWLL